MKSYRIKERHIILWLCALMNPDEIRPAGNDVFKMTRENQTRTAISHSPKELLLLSQERCAHIKVG